MSSTIGMFLILIPIPGISFVSVSVCMSCHVSIIIGMNHQLWLVEIRRYWIFHPIRDSDSYIFGDILSFCDIVRGLEYCQSSLKWYHRKGYLRYLWYYFYLKTWLGYLWNIEIYRNIYYCCSTENSTNKQYPSLDHQSTNSDHIYTEIGEISKIWPHLSPIPLKYNESSAWYQYWYEFQSGIGIGIGISMVVSVPLSSCGSKH